MKEEKTNFLNSFWISGIFKNRKEKRKNKKTEKSQAKILEDAVNVENIPETRKLYYTTKNNSRMNLINTVYLDYKGNVPSIIITDNIFKDGVGCLITVQDITAIPARMFEGNTDIMTIRYPETLREIGSYAFKDCTNFKGLYPQTGENSIMKIGMHAFENTNIEAIHIPDNVNEIGEYAFASCKNLNEFSCNNERILKSNIFDNCNEIFLKNVERYFSTNK